MLEPVRCTAVRIVLLGTLTVIARQLRAARTLSRSTALRYTDPAFWGDRVAMLRGPKRAQAPVLPRDIRR